MAYGKIDSNRQRPAYDRHFHLLFPETLASRALAKAAEEEQTFSEWVRGVVRDRLDNMEAA